MSISNKLSLITLSLYALSLPLSMSGMEMFSTLSILIFISSLLLIKKDSITAFKQTNLNPLLTLIPFLIVVLISLRSATKAHFLYTLGDLRWTLILLILPSIFLLNWKHKEIVAKVIYTSLIFVSIYAITQSLTGFTFSNSSEYLPMKSISLWRAKGFFDIMTYSHSISMLFLFVYSYMLLRKTNSKRHILFTTIIGASLVLTFTRGVWFSVTVAMIIMTFIVYKKKALPFNCWRFSSHEWTPIQFNTSARTPYANL